MRGRLDLTTRFPKMQVLVDFDNVGYGLMENWTDITEFVLDVSGSKESEGDVLGGVSSDIITFTVDNSSNAFSVDNPSSLFYQKAKSNLRFVLMTGFKDEFLVPYVTGYVHSMQPKWKSKEYLLKATCPMEKLKRADAPTQSFYDVTWTELVTSLLDQAGIEPYFIREIPQTELFYKYFKFEEKKCFDNLKKLMEPVAGKAFFDGRYFKALTKLEIGYVEDRTPKHEIISEDFFEFEEVINDGRIINKISIVGEPKEIAPLQVVWETPENFVNVENEQTTYDGTEYVYIDSENLPLYWEESSNEITIKNLSNGMNVEWDVYNAELGRIHLTTTGLANVTTGDLLSISYTYQYLVLLPGQERRYVAKTDEPVDVFLEPDVKAWNSDASAEIPYSSTPDTVDTISKQSMNVVDNNTVEITLKNNTSGKISISTLQFRGYPIKVLNPIEVYNEDQPSIDDNDVREVNITNNYINNVKLAEKLSQFVIDNRSEITKELNIQINGYSELLLNDVSSVVESSSGTNHLMTIERIDFRFSVRDGWLADLTVREVPSSDWAYDGFLGDSYVPPIGGTPPVPVTQPYHKGATAPENTNMFWVDTTTNPPVTKVYDTNTGSWIKANPTTPEEIGAETPQGAQDKADQARDDAIDTSIGYTDQETAKRELAVFKQPTTPSNPVVNQLWIDTSTTPNYIKKWNGTTWDTLGPTSASDIGAVDSVDYEAEKQAMLEDIADKANLTYVNGELSGKANIEDLQSKADVTYVDGQLAFKQSSIPQQTTTPTSPTDKMLWLDTSVTPNILKRYDASTTSWISATPTEASEVGAYTITEVDTALQGKVSTSTYNVDQQGIVTRFESAESRITQTETDITSKVEQTSFNSLEGRVSTAESNISQNATAITSKVEQTTFNSLEGRVDTAESTITQHSTQIASKVDQTSYTTDKNGIINRLDTAESNITQNANAITSKVSTTTYEADITDPTNGLKSRMSTAESTISQHSTEIASKVSQTTFNSLESRMDTAESSITQNANAIQSKVESSTFNSLEGRVDTAESTLTQHASEISSRVTTTTYNSGMASKENTVYKQSTAPSHSNGRLWLDTSTTPNVLKRSTGSAWVKATPTTASEVGAYSSSEGSSLAGRVTTAESNITQNATAIQSKVSTTTFNALESRMDSAESTITQHSNEIQARVTTTTFNSLESRVDTAESTITQHSNQIASKVSQSEYDIDIPNLQSRMSTAESSITQNANSITSKVSTTTFNTELAKKENEIIKSTSFPSNPTTNMLFMNISTTPPKIWRWTGSMWARATPSVPSDVGAYPWDDGYDNRLRIITAESTITQHADEIELKVDKSGVVNSINVSSEGIRINGSKVHITGSTSIDNAVIKSAHIESLDASKVNATTLSAITANIGNVTAGSISGVSITEGTITGASINSSNSSTGTLSIIGGQVISEMDNVDIVGSTDHWDRRAMVSYGELTSRSERYNSSGTLLHTNLTTYGADYISTSLGDGGPFSFRMNDGAQFSGGTESKVELVNDTFNSGGTPLSKITLRLLGDFNSNAIVENPSGTLTLRGASGTTVNNTLTVNGSVLTSGAVEGTLKHISGYMQIQPYNSSYDDGSYFRMYWDGNQRSLICSARNSTDSLIANLYLGGGEIDCGDVNARHLEPSGRIISPETYTITSGSSANIYVSSAGYFSRSTSSIKYKKDVEDLWDGEAEKVLDLRPVWYRSTSPEGTRDDWSHIGLIAEEVHKIEPRLVHYKEIFKEVRDEDKNIVEKIPINPEELEPDGVQYEKLAVYMLPLLKKQNERIKQLESNYNSLLERLEKLENNGL